MNIPEGSKGILTDFTVAYFLLRDMQQRYALSSVAGGQIAKFQLAIIKLQAALASSSTPPVASWDDADRISDIPVVHEALSNFACDTTGDNGSAIVRAILGVIKSTLPEVEPVYQVFNEGSWDDVSKERYDRWVGKSDLSPCRILYTSPPSPEVKYVSPERIHPLSIAVQEILPILYKELPEFHKEWSEMRDIIFQGAPSPKASWDADGNPLTLEAAARDVMREVDSFWGLELPEIIENKLEVLRKFLGES